jgi:sugar-specific transcriptional regulator TrmB
MPDTDPIITKLFDFGLSQTESQTYLALSGKDSLTVLELSRLTGLPRTTIYDTLAKLSERGLIEKIVSYKSQSFRAFPISILSGDVKNKENEALKLKQSLEALIELVPTAKSPSPHTQVRYYHGAHGFRQMMTRSLNAQKEMVGYSVFGRAKIVGQKFIDSWIAEMNSRGIKDRVIANNSPEILAYLGKKEEQAARTSFQSTRFLPKSTLYISGDTTIYNNTFAVCWWDKGEVVGVEIENPELVRTQKSIFEILWKIAQTK